MMTLSTLQSMGMAKPAEPQEERTVTTVRRRKALPVVVVQVILRLGPRRRERWSSDSHALGPPRVCPGWVMVPVGRLLTDLRERGKMSYVGKRAPLMG